MPPDVQGFISFLQLVVMWYCSWYRNCQRIQLIAHTSLT